ncbi:UbiD family decarboxylase domain-containing protein [Streptomyces sp. NPDC051956]|uniref:UbiD family decarboxylase domain-containing protein n=1 Tax=Streptomyces sp. NPDC051956 TaxID=3365677 RepID=UPI0037CFE892
MESPFGEFTGHCSGTRSQPVTGVKQVSHRTNPIFEHLCLGMPWTEMDYTLTLNTSVPLYRQLKADFPEVVAVSAMYTQSPKACWRSCPSSSASAATPTRSACATARW